ncbi:hypothetical protein KR084_008641 [Drosophila pseudotakahashii]|nr:hypothetical protein KR084_008641 [Drosophila pseudotakahashii]
MKLIETFRIDYFRNQLIAWRIGGAIELSGRNYCSWAMGLNVITFLQTTMLLKAMFTFNDPMVNNFNFTVAITSLSAFIKFSMYVPQLTKLVGIHRIVAQLDARVSGQAQVHRRRRMSNDLRRLSKIFLITYGIMFINAATSFLFKSERSLPLPMWIPFDWTNSMVAYIGVLVFQAIALFVQVMHNFSGDSFAPLALFLVSEQCQLLTLRISNIGYGSKTLKENEHDLVNCIKDQNSLYSLLESVQIMISYPMMVQFLVIGISTAATLFGLIFYVDSLYDRAYYVCFLLALTLQTYPLCYYGTRVEESFAELHYAVFCSNWVEQSATYRGYMLILEERTKRKQIVLAANLLPIHMSTFVACWKGAYSFFTLMVDRRNDFDEAD